MSWQADLAPRMRKTSIIHNHSAIIIDVYGIQHGDHHSYS